METLRSGAVRVAKHIEFSKRRAAGAGISWLYPFVDGAPPIGWEAASAYLVFPVLVVVAQW